MGDKRPEDFQSTYTKLLASTAAASAGLKFGGDVDPPERPNSHYTRPDTAPSADVSQKRESAGVDNAKARHGLRSHAANLLSRSAPELAAAKRPNSAAASTAKPGHKAAAQPTINLKGNSGLSNASKPRGPSEGPRRSELPLESRHGHSTTNSQHNVMAKARQTMQPKRESTSQAANSSPDLSLKVTPHEVLDVCCFKGETERLLANCTRTLAARFAAELAGKDNSTIRQAQRREGLWAEVDKGRQQSFPRT